jgi:hypothetical protein
MRSVDPTPYIKSMGQPIKDSLGVKPGLAWLPVTNLRINPAYQREILQNGRRNIVKIATNFDWSLFGIIVVANIGNNLFAIVDGQHRTTAAALRGIEEVPCIIIHADPAKQAEAFAAINGAVTAISPLAIFAAQVAAEDPEALKLVDVCSRAGVTICRYPVPSNKMAAGDTLAIQSLQGCISMYGEDILLLALRSIMKAARMKPGFVKAPAIKAFCQVLEAERKWCSHEARLMAAMERFDLASAISNAEASAKASRRQIHKSLAIALFDYLDEELG